jgi:hypothetical protein
VLRKVEVVTPENNNLWFIGMDHRRTKGKKSFPFDFIGKEGISQILPSIQTPDLTSFIV